MDREILIQFEVYDNRNPHNDTTEYKEKMDSLVSFFGNDMKYCFNEDTTILDLLHYICKAAPYDPHENYDDHDLPTRFFVRLNNKLKTFGCLDCKLIKCLNYIGITDTLILRVIIGYPGGGASLGEIDGIRYYIYPKEKNHMGKPHVHAEYSGRKMSIGILDSYVLEGSLPKKKQKQAQNDVRNNRGFLIHEWNEYNCGFAISEEGYYIDSKQKKMRPIPYG